MDKKDDKTHEIEYFTPPLIKEILAQQRIILEMQKELFKILAYPPMIYKEKTND